MKQTDILQLTALPSWNLNSYMTVLTSQKEVDETCRTLKVFPFLPTGTFPANPLSLMINGPNTLLPAKVITCLSLLNIVWMQPLGGTRTIHRSALKEKALQLEKEVEEFETWDVFSWPQCCINIIRPSYVLATNVELPQPFWDAAGVTLHTLGSSVERSFVLCSCAAIVVRTHETYEKTQTSWRRSWCQKHSNQPVPSH